MRDAIELGKRGVPAVIVLPKGFVALARAKAAAFGMPELPLAILPVILYGRTLGEMTTLAHGLRAELLAALAAVRAG